MHCKMNSSTGQLRIGCTRIILSCQSGYSFSKPTLLRLPTMEIESFGKHGQDIAQDDAIES